MRRENGVAVPDGNSPAPYMMTLTLNGLGTLASKETGEQPDLAFVLHAANYHARLASVVGEFVRLFQRWQGDPKGFDYKKFQEDDAKLRADALALWTEMQEEVMR
jgi:hypothetical protein